MAEFLVSGTVNPTYIKVIPFRGNIFELSNEKFLQSCDIFRLLLCLYLAYTIYLKVRYHRPDVISYEDQDYGVFMMGLLIDCGIIFFFFFAWVLSYVYSNKHTIDMIRAGSTKGGVINGDKYVDYVDKGSWYHESFNQDAVSLMFVLLKLIWVFKFSRYVHWIFLTIDKVNSNYIITFNLRPSRP